MSLLPGHRRAAAAEEIPPRLRTPRASAWWIVPTALLVGGVVGGVAWLLLGAGWDVTEAAARQGAIQTALAAGAGVGAAVTLMLAFRRQRHQEHAAHVTAFLAEQAAEHHRYDAAERRVTDLYVKAAEQLGHDKAAVRLAGLYALERLGQDNPGHRQTVVNVLCAYLRMPFTPQPDLGQERTAALRAARSRYRAARPKAAAAEPAPSGNAGDHEGELQVRLTAQRILAAHVRDDQTLMAAPAFWEGMSLDLTGAALVDFELTDGRLAAAGFERARFYGPARFRRTTFCGETVFNDATFTDDAWFNDATFRHDASFDNAAFHGRAWFRCVAFSGDAWFHQAAFREGSMDSVPGAAMFDEATFDGFANFAKATFSGCGNFNKVTFTGDAGFTEAAFSQGAGFAGTVFSGDARFRTADFSGLAMFGNAVFTRSAEFSGTVFAGGIWFDEAAFGGDACFDEVSFLVAAGFDKAAFSGPANFDKATFTTDAWFRGGTFTGTTTFEGATFGGLAAFAKSTFSSRLSFDRAAFSGVAGLHECVLTDRAARHVLPPGWRLATSEASARLVHQEKNGT